MEATRESKRATEFNNFLRTLEHIFGMGQGRYVDHAVVICLIAEPLDLRGRAHLERIAG